MILPGLDSLKALSKNKEPTNLEYIYYIFWEKGIDLERFNRLPIPYILGVLKVNSYIKKEEEKHLKKQQRKK